jgi:hypothetical protein
MQVYERAFLLRFSARSAGWILGRRSVQAGEQCPDDGNRLTAIGRPAGQHIGIKETLADPDDRVSERGRVELGVEAAAAALKVDEPLQSRGHAGRGDAAAAGEDAQRGIGVSLD